LIHRSQKDPLAADSDAPQRLLQAIPDQKGAKQQKEEEHEFGVFYDDEYDYLQHLKKRDENEKDFDEIDRFLLDKDDLKTEEKKPSKKEPQLSSNLKLPNIVFASGTEEEVGLLNKAARSQGPLLDWDPEIVETLDDEFTHEVVYTLKDLERQDEEEEEEEAMEENELDEILAGAKVERDDDDECSDDYDDYDSDEANDDVPSLDGGFSTFSAEETKSKFTSYSMSSSVIRRNDGLSLLDDKFDKFFDGYDDENMGYLDMDDVEGSKAETSEVMSHVLKDFEKQQATRRQKMTEHDLAGTTIAEDNSDTDKELEEKEVDKDEDKFDCESIISTYSTLYNHPKLIKEPSIKVCIIVI
jgi:protein LTV1